MLLVIELIRRAFKLDRSPVDPNEQRKETVPLTPQPVVQVRPPTAQEAELERSEKYVTLLEEIKAEQAAEIAKQDTEIAELRGRVEWLERQLNALMDRFVRPPQQPPSSPGWMPPPGV